jgi:hypothetical protein
MSLIGLIKSFSFSGGDAAARGVRAIQTTQRGEIRSAPEARWVAFTAEETVNASTSSFRWDARLGTGLTAVRVIDAYESGQGRLVVKKGPLKLKEFAGPEFDRGELQRYLAYLNYCPPMIENNSSLQFEPLGPSTLRVSDKSEKTGASVDLEIDGTGRVIVARAIRPMALGSRIAMMPWSATTNDFREWEGLRIPFSMEAAWALPAGVFTYIRIALTSVAVIRNSGPAIASS